MHCSCRTLCAAQSCSFPQGMDRPSGSTMELVVESLPWLPSESRPYIDDGRPKSAAAGLTGENYIQNKPNAEGTGRPHSAAAATPGKWFDQTLTIVRQRLETETELKSSKQAELDGYNGRTYKPTPLKKVAAQSPAHHLDQRSASNGNRLGKLGLQPWSTWAAPLGNGAQIMSVRESALGGAPSASSSSPLAAPMLAATPPPQVANPSDRKATKGLRKQPSAQTLRTLRGSTRTPTPTDGTPSRGRSSKSSRKLDSQRRHVQAGERSEMMENVEIRLSSLTEEQGGKHLQRRSRESYSTSNASHVAENRTRRRRAATTREPKDPQKTIGTIEWARSTASAIAASSPKRRHSPSTSRTSRTPSPEKSVAKEHSSPTRELFSSPGSSGAQASPISSSEAVSGEARSPDAVMQSQFGASSGAGSHHDSPGMTSAEMQPHDDVGVAEESGSFIEELTDPIPPLVQVPGGKALLLLREFSSRIAGSEGKAHAVEVEEREANHSSTASSIAPTAQLLGSQRKAKISFDSVSHSLLPWPLPIEKAIEQLASSGKNDALANGC